MNKEQVNEEFENVLADLANDFNTLRNGGKVDENALVIKMFTASALGAKLVDEFGVAQEAVSKRIDDVLD